MLIVFGTVWQHAFDTQSWMNIDCLSLTFTYYGIAVMCIYDAITLWMLKLNDNIEFWTLAKITPRHTVESGVEYEDINSLKWLTSNKFGSASF